MNKVTKTIAMLITVALVGMVLMFNNVFAAGTVPFPTNNGTANPTGTPTAGGNTTNTTNTNTTNTTNTNTTNTTRTNTTNTTNTSANTNTINNLTKDKEELPKTGEFDVYIISIVAVAVVLIGGFAFAKSRKIN